MSSSDGKSLRVGNRVDSPITSPPYSRLTFQLVSLFLLSSQSTLRLEKKGKKNTQNHLGEGEKHVYSLLIITLIAVCLHEFVVLDY